MRLAYAYSIRQEWKDSVKKQTAIKKYKDDFLTGIVAIPGTSVSLPVLTLIGNKEMYIENIKSIMEYNNTCVKVLTKRGAVYVKGEQLDIGYLDEDEISIKGKIVEITFD